MDPIALVSIAGLFAFLTSTHVKHAQHLPHPLSYEGLLSLIQEYIDGNDDGG